MVAHLADYRREKPFEKVLLGLGWKFFSNSDCLFVHRKQGLFLSVYLGDMNMAGRKRNLHPVWKKFDETC